MEKYRSSFWSWFCPEWINDLVGVCMNEAVGGSIEEYVKIVEQFIKKYE